MFDVIRLPSSLTLIQGEEIETMELTILMPCLNEAETVGARALPRRLSVTKAVDFLRRTGIEGEVAVADNGSNDSSRELAEANGARVVTVPEKGYGSALIGEIRSRM